jgi:hypothetical protein
VAVVAAARRRHARGREPVPRGLGLAAFVIAGVPFLVHAWVALHGYFGQDDFVVMYRAAHADPLDFGYLFQAHNGEHLQPGTFLLAWVETAVAPLNFTVAVLPLIVLHGLAVWLFWRVLVRLFGYRWGLLPALAVLGASPLILAPTLWWAYGMELLPLLVATGAALVAHLRYLDTGATRYAVQAGAAVVAGMLFYEKAALIAGVLFAVTVLRGTTVAEALVRHWRLWAAHAVLLIGYLTLYFGLTAEQANAKPIHANDIAQFTKNAVIDTFLPGVLGGPFTNPSSGASWVTPALVVRIAAVVVTLVLVAVSRKKPWLFLVAYLAVDLALVIVARLWVVGPVVGTDPRYLADAVPVAVICAAFALRERHVKEPVAVGLAVLLVAASTVSFLKLAPGLQFRHAKDYVATARQALEQQPDIVLYDTTVPNDIILNWFIYDNFTSRVVGLLPDAPPFDQPAETLYQLDSTGRPQPITGITDEVRGEQGPAKDCGHLVDEEPVRIPLTGPSAGRRVLELGYYTGDTADGTITAGDTRVPVHFRSGLHVVYVVVSGTFTHIEVARNVNVKPLCVTDVTIGVPD